MSVELYQQFLQQFNYVSEQVKSNTVYKNITHFFLLIHYFQWK